MTDLLDIAASTVVEDIARGIVCDASVSVLDAVGADPSDIKVQVAMNRATDRAIERLARLDAALRCQVIREIGAGVQLELFPEAA
jgi:hypothetical protein